MAIGDHRMIVLIWMNCSTAACCGVPCGGPIVSEEGRASDEVSNAPTTKKPLMLARSMRRPIVAIPPITRISTLPHYSAGLIVALPGLLASSSCAISYAGLAGSTRSSVAGHVAEAR
jgi:hypothetical protein